MSKYIKHPKQVTHVEKLIKHHVGLANKHDAKAWSHAHKRGGGRNKSGTPAYTYHNILHGHNQALRDTHYQTARKLIKRLHPNERGHVGRKTGFNRLHALRSKSIKEYNSLYPKIRRI